MRFFTLFTALVAASSATYAQEAPPEPEITQLWSCHLNPGQGIDNIWAYLEDIRGRAGEMELEPGFSVFLWLPFKGSHGYDYVWGINSSNLESMAQGYADWVKAGNDAAVGTRYQTLNAHCDSSVVIAEAVQVGAIGNTGDRTPDAFVETFACRLNDGSSMADVRGAVEHWRQQVAKLAVSVIDSYLATLLLPFRGGSGDVQFGWIGAYPDLVSWGKGSQLWTSSKPGQENQARFDKVSTCSSALWNGYWVVPPAG